LNGFDEEPAAKARKYVAALRNALQKTNTKTSDAKVAAVNIRKVTDAVKRYLQDAEHYLNNGRATTSLASVAYAEGLLDALVFLELTADGISE